MASREKGFGFRYPDQPACWAIASMLVDGGSLPLLDHPVETAATIACHQAIAFDMRLPCTASSKRAKSGSNEVLHCALTLKLRHHLLNPTSHHPTLDNIHRHYPTSKIPHAALPRQHYAHHGLRNFKTRQNIRTTQVSEPTTALGFPLRRPKRRHTQQAQPYGKAPHQNEPRWVHDSPAEAYSGKGRPLGGPEALPSPR
ncbi:hypothetical protein LTR73_006133 [Friedmanniomyces endolithicus]|nr:hypothetical protein LTR73_006133 [Friedmanniomyces endolithicus]